jgi:predicted ester cyclase
MTEGDPMATQDRRSLIERLETAMNRRELDKLDDILAADFVRHCEATPGLVVESLEDFKAFLRADVAVFPDNVQTFTHVAVDGDLIGVFATYEGTHLGPYGAFPPTGKRAKFDFAGMFKVADQKLAELWITWDNMTILAQLGLLPGADETT